MSLYSVYKDLKGDKSNDSKIWLINNSDKTLSSEEFKKYKSYIDERSKQKPIAHSINKKYFYGLEYYIDENVLIPRP